MDGQNDAAVIEVLDRDGHVRAVHKITQWPTRIGRSPSCEVVLDDGHVAAEHAELVWLGAGPGLRLLPSLNGGWLGERRLAVGDAAALVGSALFQLGSTQMRWRSAADPIAPEQSMQSHQLRAVKQPAFWLPVLLLLWLGSRWFEQWLAMNPGSPWTDYATPVLVPLALLLVWAGLWSLMTQVFQHRFPFATHMRRALVAMIVGDALSAGLAMFAFALSWPRLMALDSMLVPAFAAGLLWWHASLVWPRARRGIAIILAGLLLGGLVLTAARRQEQQHWFGPAYLSVLPPPALRIVAPKPVSALIDDLRPLQAELARQAKKDGDQAGDDDEKD